MSEESQQSPVQQPAEDVVDALQEGYQQAESMIRERPTESIAVAFGAGVVVGVVVGLLLTSK